MSPPEGRPQRGRPRSDAGSRRRGSSGPTQARLIAIRVLERVQRVHSFADLTLHHALTQSDLAGPDRALTTELVYGTLRWRGRLDFLLSKVVDRSLDDLEPLVANCLRLGAYQIIFTDRIPATAAVDQAVHCIRALGAERATGLVNAALRRLAREHEQIALPELDADPMAHLRDALSLPWWIAERWLRQYGPEQSAALARASNEAPPLTVRANRQATDPDSLLAELRERFPEAASCRYAPDGIVLGRRGIANHDPAFLAGRFTPQDEASQLVIELLDPQPGDRVLDVCAAPGGKTSGIAERVGASGEVIARDRHSARLALVARDARRLRLPWIRTAQRDATRDPQEGDADTEAFDRVLVDAPCSGLGTLRRNPDARWRVRPGDIETLAVLQRSILDRAAKMVRRGGVLVYSTCTLTTEENEELVRSFLQGHPDFRVTPANALPTALEPLIDEEGFMRCLPQLHDADGFFAARLERVS